MDVPGLKSRLPQPLAERIESCVLTDGAVTIVMSAGGLGATGREKAEAAVRAALAGENVRDVRIAFTAAREAEPVRRAIVIGSGKGGVGKSTLTANLAVALKRAGHSVGIVDADIYGPSQPTLLGNANTQPEDSDGRLIPVMSDHGVPMLSMGQLVAADKALAWRGPMVTKALAQLLDAQWDGTDLLLIDLPPGTGDVQLSILQRHRPAGAVIVSTPQDLALIDAKRALQLFELAEVPIIGMVENMAGYVCPHCGKASDPFGNGGAEAAAQDAGLPFLGRVPLAASIRLASDAGMPVAASDGDGNRNADGAGAGAFAAIAAQIDAWLQQVVATPTSPMQAS